MMANCVYGKLYHRKLSMVFTLIICLLYRKIEKEPTFNIIPQYLLIGHTAPILCICKTSIIPDYNFIVSSSECGEMCLWDLTDGKCMESVKLPQVHTNLQSYHMSGTEDVRLFCNGYYAEILIMNSFSLEILFSLSSKVSPDWISALHVSTMVAFKNA